MSQDGFQRALDQIRSIATHQADKGRLFERLMAAFFKEDPVYRERFSGVWLWKDWVDKRLAEAAKYCPSRRYHPPPPPIWFR